MRFRGLEIFHVSVRIRGVRNISCKRASQGVRNISCKCAYQGVRNICIRTEYIIPNAVSDSWRYNKTLHPGKYSRQISKYSIFRVSHP